ncbi:YbgA family protein [Planomonospora venezuelensis]|uniref:Uncharacterized protein YbgA (DUF1722 family)/uncharacterized protein YbbK (DUF523 family) n=1 Tax=Planomonospora venezuelensis TaxID=1999 RepID=A0A841DBN9_PLAVE|nr:DUF523 and DUF1722 domain-containing protein [Planomonospora venezuelensis]MBB5965515.1 uncharacterized protein YbgA (DUF1722 family)/uncharacterized protein YbbK (DUF523 family) [Planomonospora venezuelensis]
MKADANDEVRPCVAVSGCLIGELVRFNGGHSRDRFVSGELDPYVDWVPVCPEVEIGLGAPRESLHLERSSDGPHLIGRKTRADHTARMAALAAERARGLDVDGYVFKAKSPSCGIHGVPLYDGQALVDRKNRGLFAAQIMDAHPLLPVEDEGRLNDPLLRETFVERIFAHARLRAFLASGWSPRDLVAFHARHKMQLLSHDPVAYAEAGRVVALAGVLDRRELADRYGRAFRTALSSKPSIGRHVNALQHCAGMIGDSLDAVRRADLAEAIASYQAGLVSLSVPAALLRHDARGEGADWVREQTYLAPYPEALRLRNHVPA